VCRQTMESASALAAFLPGRAASWVPTRYYALTRHPASVAMRTGREKWRGRPLRYAARWDLDGLGHARAATGNPDAASNARTKVAVAPEAAGQQQPSGRPECRRPAPLARHARRRGSGLPEWVAERVGFEPTVRLPAHRISSAAHSTTLPPLREGNALERKPRPKRARRLAEAGGVAKTRCETPRWNNARPLLV
jgi:hypothetical protein